MPPPSKSTLPSPSKLRRRLNSARSLAASRQLSLPRGPCCHFQTFTAALYAFASASLPVAVLWPCNFIHQQTLVATLSDIQISWSCLHVTMPTATLKTSRHPYHHTCSDPSDLHPAMSPWSQATIQHLRQTELILHGLRHTRAVHSTSTPPLPPPPANSTHPHSLLHTEKHTLQHL
jgi:hypothetical protein